MREMEPETRTDGVVVVGLDGSENAGHAARWAAAYAARTGARIIAVHAAAQRPAGALVAAPELVYPDESPRHWDGVDESEEFVGTWCAPLRRPGTDLETVMRPARAPALLIEVARRHDADVIVIGSRGRNRITESVLGSTGRTLARRSVTPVAIVKGPVPASPFQRIVVGVDRSCTAEQAVAWAARLAGTTGADLVLTGVIDPRALGPDERRQAWESARRYLDATARGAGLTAHPLLREGIPAATLLETAREQSASLIVVGSRQRSGLVEAFLGSVSHEVVAHSELPVVIVPPCILPTSVRADDD